MLTSSHELAKSMLAGPGLKLVDVETVRIGRDAEDKLNGVGRCQHLAAKYCLLLLPVSLE